MENKAIDTPIIKSEYRNYDLVARFCNDPYRGRIGKNTSSVADYVGDNPRRTMSQQQHTLMTALSQTRDYCLGVKELTQICNFTAQQASKPAGGTRLP